MRRFPASAWACGGRPVLPRPSTCRQAPTRQFVRGLRSPAVHHGRIVADELEFIRESPDEVPPMSISVFKEEHFHAGQPLLIKRAVTGHMMPALHKWFPSQGQGHSGIADKLPQNLHSTSLHYEVWRPGPHARDVWATFLRWLEPDMSKTGRHVYRTLYSGLKTGGEGNEFHTFGSSMHLMLKALQFNACREDGAELVKSLYIAQQSLEDLPLALQKDVQAPPIVKLAGQGDLYGSSLWLGLEPTLTPWHRDPNPNLFVQLVGQKTIRFLNSNEGLRIFRSVAKRLGTPRHPTMRGSEMMQGPDREAFYDAVWGPDCPENMFEVTVSAGDALFIPHLWWHSVRSVHEDARLNASVNWWFR